ncbi:MAG TPA: YbaB/EbfC family nucleoid-associated protein [Halanaerobiaceae bacterium]|jgi:DNA-binding YbaB/EbfC family protein|nr:YbaB/EbfC family nucleoid-associated protein [Bacillota bacterium]HHU91679.1 YbaB/EbfC family nucleoid-associated protein [Halanaerobiaceae bacterium]HOA40638.1 YbaB/EbfC family nucleoid-associated protein [Halanaerobiales bacterium]HPZ63131.1 YbaB/EbfC family nucleoid-associated protein [Halanaerobiales bacterium]HQD04753.1 YbaB/EbfC family nucleoid-associated protein [Halanaerobiales bacterium]
MNINKLMKQAQQMQAQMAKMQEELEEKTLEATAGGGVVKVVVNGRQEFLDIKIDPEAVDPDDVEMLEDLILAAVNEALRKVQDMINQEMGKITGGMNIPGMF